MIYQFGSGLPASDSARWCFFVVKEVKGRTEYWIKTRNSPPFSVSDRDLRVWEDKSYLELRKTI